ncbi:MAG: transposase, partial [Candidatus Brocadia sp.]|nr:transposase [Candidatus Brocadia sp.]
EFNGGYCYLPLYIFCDGYLLCAKLRTSGVDASEGAKEEIGRIVNHIRSQWPGVKIVVRGDSGFAREEIMSWCESNQVDYLFGPARNSRLQEEIQGEMEEARKQYTETGRASRVYKDFFYKTVKSWSRERRVVGKAEH